VSSDGALPAQPILCAPGALKGVLSGQDAADALTAGIQSRGRFAIPLPVADGGEGTAKILARELGGRWHVADVHDPLGRPIAAEFLELPNTTVVVEIAAAAGLTLLEPREQDPLTATTEGVGELILAALRLRPSRLLICLGGSATVDGGRGMREVIGNALEGVILDVACDVSNPLLGPRGAARAFGPQKGADEETVLELEHRLQSDRTLKPFADLPGAGSAGGLGAALASLGGRLTSGAKLVLDTLRFEEHLRASSLVVTGEGIVDATTFEGKVPGLVLATASRAGVPAVAFGGIVKFRPAGFDIRELSGRPEQAASDLLNFGRTLACESFAVAGEVRRTPDRFRRY
jgi:glycerate kinase